MKKCAAGTRRTGSRGKHPGGVRTRRPPPVPATAHRVRQPARLQPHRARLRRGACPPCDVGEDLKDATGRRVNCWSEPNPTDFRRNPAGAPAPGHRAEPRRGAGTGKGPGTAEDYRLPEISLPTGRTQPRRLLRRPHHQRRREPPVVSVGVWHSPVRSHRMRRCSS